MIISNSKKFIFVHIMKAAGTTITRSLDEYLQWNDIVLGSTPLGEAFQGGYRERFSLHKHSRATEIQQVVGIDIWNDYFTFTFVRNPYDRAVSLYRWIQGMVQSAGFKRHFPFRLINKKPFWNYPGTKAYLQAKSFSDFIRNEALLKSAPGFKEQVEWILDEDGRIVVDFIGKVETIDKDYEKIARTIDVDATALRVHNKSSVNHRFRPLQKESDYEYLYQRFRRDFDILGYDPTPLK